MSSDGITSSPAQSSCHSEFLIQQMNLYAPELHPSAGNWPSTKRSPGSCCNLELILRQGINLTKSLWANSVVRIFNRHRTLHTVGTRKLFVDRVSLQTSQ